MEADGGPAGRLAENGDVVGIASKLGNVVTDPRQSHQLIEEAGVAGHVLRVEEQKAQRGHAVLKRHHDDILFRR